MAGEVESCGPNRLFEILSPQISGLIQTGLGFSARAEVRHVIATKFNFSLFSQVEISARAEIRHVIRLLGPGHNYLFLEFNFPASLSGNSEQSLMGFT